MFKLAAAITYEASIRLVGKVAVIVPPKSSLVADMVQGSAVWMQNREKQMDVEKFEEHVVSAASPWTEESETMDPPPGAEPRKAFACTCSCD